MNFRIIENSTFATGIAKVETECGGHEEIFSDKNNALDRIRI